MQQGGLRQRKPECRGAVGGKLEPRLSFLPPRSYIYEGGALRPVPSSRSEVFKDRSLGLAQVQCLAGSPVSGQAGLPGQATEQGRDATGRGHERSVGLKPEEFREGTGREAAAFRARFVVGAGVAACTLYVFADSLCLALCLLGASVLLALQKRALMKFLKGCTEALAGEGPLQVRANC